MPDSKITIRLPETLAAKLAATADRYEVTRTAILLDLLARGIDDWEPAQRRTAQSDVVRLENAIEVLRLELAEAIERIDRVERRTVAQSRPAKSDCETFTTRELAARFGWDATNAARNARKNGWVEVGRSGRTVVWAKET